VKLSRRDSFSIVAVFILLLVLALGTLRGKGQDTPFDDLHRSSYLAIKSGRSRTDVELVCTTCHSKSSLALSKQHPPKEQCLLCHKLITEDPGRF
jgi:hypothetical protein